VDRSLRYLKARFPDAHAWQVSAVGTKDYQTPDGIRVAPALKLLDHTGIVSQLGKTPSYPRAW
jgi:hypothetical protein